MASIRDILLNGLEGAIQGKLNEQFPERFSPQNDVQAPRDTASDEIKIAVEQTNTTIRNVAIGVGFLLAIVGIIVVARR